MKMDRIVELMEANGRCVREFAEFLKEAKPEQLNALRKILKNGRRWMAQDSHSDIEAAAIEVAVEIMAVGVVSADEADAAFKKSARELGGHFACAAYRMYAEKAPKEDFDQLKYLLERIGDKPFVTALKIMREMIAANEETPKPAADAGEPAASLVNLSESLAAAEPKEEEAISEIDNIEKKFQELKAEGTPLEWLSLFVSNSNSINLTGEEFEAALATVRKMREEELAPDPALVDEAVAAMKRAAESVRMRRKEAQPQE
jgi:hypothetical protein